MPVPQPRLVRRKSHFSVFYPDIATRIPYKPPGGQKIACCQHHVLQASCYRHTDDYLLVEPRGFGDCREIQRCQWHKRENLVSYLPKNGQKTWRSKLQRSYQEPTYEAAEERLTGLHAGLQQMSRPAAHSLMEGLEETLTLHRLGVFEELGRSLKTLGCT
jgi:hypothetical protein